MKKLLVMAVATVLLSGCGQVKFTNTDLEMGNKFCEANGGVKDHLVDTISVNNEVYKIITTCNNRGTLTYHIKRG